MGDFENRPISLTEKDYLIFVVAQQMLILEHSMMARFWSHSSKEFLMNRIFLLDANLLHFRCLRVDRLWVFFKWHPMIALRSVIKN